LGMKVKQGKSVIWLILKVPLLITISMESSQRDLFIDRFTFNNDQITPSVCSTFIRKQVGDYLNQGLVFTVQTLCMKI